MIWRSASNREKSAGLSVKRIAIGRGNTRQHHRSSPGSAARQMNARLADLMRDHGMDTRELGDVLLDAKHPRKETKARHIPGTDYLLAPLLAQRRKIERS